MKEKLEAIRKRAEHLSQNMKYWGSIDAASPKIVGELLCTVDTLLTEIDIAIETTRQEAYAALCSRCMDGELILPPEGVYPYWGHSTFTTSAGTHIPATRCGADSLRRHFEQVGTAQALPMEVDSDAV